MYFKKNFLQPHSITLQCICRLVFFFSSISRHQGYNTETSYPSSRFYRFKALLFTPADVFICAYSWWIKNNEWNITFNAIATIQNISSIHLIIWKAHTRFYLLRKLKCLQLFQTVPLPATRISSSQSITDLKKHFAVSFIWSTWIIFPWVFKSTTLLQLRYK